MPSQHQSLKNLYFLLLFCLFNNGSLINKYFLMEDNFPLANISIKIISLSV